MKKNLHAGLSSLQAGAADVQGEEVMLDGEGFYRIVNYDRMRPFFVSVVSSSDHWMFISSTGALTAGRGNAELALFPYHTDDKIHDSAEITGSKTILITERGGGKFFWEPFSERYRGIYRIRRSVYKNIAGNKLLFEECNQDLGLTFRYGWFNSDRFGWVRKAWLTYRGSGSMRVRLLDGIQNLLPWGVGSELQLTKSTLVDAYKKNELLAETGIGLYTLSSIIIDRPEPAEALKANVAWSLGLPRSLKLLSATQLDRFREGFVARQEVDVRAERGAYFVQAEVVLHRGESQDWTIVADVDVGASEVTELDQFLREPARLGRMLEADIERGTQELQRIVASGDGVQKTARTLGDARHFNNVLFNVMRGGVFRDGCAVDRADLQQFVKHANRDVATRQAAFFRKLPKNVHCSRVVELAAATGDANLERLCREYLPLTFSRRHGDPSRPWNRFSIPSRNPDGSRILNYEGNWRDIFQNWEALALSYPAFVSGMICKFVNATTADGYNPYRISRDGMDWEVADPTDPWSHIGYWGDHQIIYLLKLLEIFEQHEPAALQQFLTRKIFTHASVPYRIKPYAQMLVSPKETVVFDQAVEDLVQSRVRALGSDGKLVWDRRGHIELANLAEKLLILTLAKLANFIPEAGIWMNTQRPEWNDANNALVGNGVSVVTLCYLRRFLEFCVRAFRSLENGKVELSGEVAGFLRGIHRTLERHHELLKGKINDRDRRRMLNELQHASDRYHRQVYGSGFSGVKTRMQAGKLIQFFNLALRWVDHSVRANRREDGMYHAYNLVSLDRKATLPIRRLYEMLEGQVAALSSGCLSAKESLGVLRALRRSAMYRADQHSYLLYPDRRLPRFTEKNNISPGDVRRSRLLRKLIADGDRSLVERDVRGRYHFNGYLANAGEVRKTLDQLAGAGYAALVRHEATLVLEIYERLFDHQSFTGRSGTFFGYEGLGSIYWHMVSKLLLAAQEVFFRGVDNGASALLLKQLAEAYYDIKAGIGDYKTPETYGAFPTDPYSHTPAHAGARQPGLTGQVKEDILCRMGELGVIPRGGEIHFRPLLLRRDEFLTAADRFEFYDVHGAKERIKLQAGSLGFTYCQVPVIYRLAGEESVRISFADGPQKRTDELRIGGDVSREIFDRSGKVKRVVVSLRMGGIAS
jgi:hypothetical protein